MTRMVVVTLGAEALVWLSGTVNTEFAAKLHEVLDGLVGQAGTPPVVDLAEVVAIDEAAIGVLASATTRAAARIGGIELRLPRGLRQRVVDGPTLRGALTAAYPSTAS
jgi:anti-anti-sigma regulatory factor